MSDHLLPPHNVTFKLDCIACRASGVILCMPENYGNTEDPTCERCWEKGIPCVYEPILSASPPDNSSIHDRWLLVSSPPVVTSGQSEPVHSQPDSPQRSRGWSLHSKSPSTSTYDPRTPSIDRGRTTPYTSSASSGTSVDDTLIEWGNRLLPAHLRLTDGTSGQICSILTLFRLAEIVVGRTYSPFIPDHAFSINLDNDSNWLMEFLFDNNLGKALQNISADDLKAGRKDKIIKLLKALKAYDKKRQSKKPTLFSGWKKKPTSRSGGTIQPPVVNSDQARTIETIFRVGAAGH